MTTTTAPDIPDTCESPTAAAKLARDLLSDRLILPDDACHDLADLDASPRAAAWGHTAWVGFRALHAYATDRAAGWDNGGFWEWCKLSGNPHAWPATAKKLAMRESETVESSRRFRKCREFSVPTSYSPTGTLYMGAHLKVSGSGGNLAPRIYFDPDPRTTIDPDKPVDLVLVGYFGPHKHVPNTRT